MHKFAPLAALAALASPSMAAYVIADNYDTNDFFSMFSFFQDADPTHGFVTYLDQADAQSAGLISTGATAHMGVDSTNVVTAGRPSVRIQSNNAYDHGLVILDAAHMPEGCGTWPAFWMIGPNWPSNGEIDIIEGVNDQVGDATTLHTSPGCTAGQTGGYSGTQTSTNCDTQAAGQASNQGCGIQSSDPATYGSGFNSNGGGVFATEWTSDHISVWFWQHADVPSDISSGAPVPSDSWGTPIAAFSTGCTIDTYFHQQQIIFDTTFCGDYAGNVWGQSATCSALASSCNDYVANNPGAFANAYWEVNSLKVYQDNGAAAAVMSTNEAMYNTGYGVNGTVSKRDINRPVAFRT